MFRVNVIFHGLYFESLPTEESEAERVCNAINAIDPRPGAGVIEDRLAFLQSVKVEVK